MQHDSRTFVLSVLAAVVLLVASRDAQAGPNLVQNGNFATNGGIGELSGGITTLANWTVGATTDGSTNPFAFVVNNQADVTGFPSVFSPPNIFVWGPGTGVSNGFTGPPSGDAFFLGVDGGYATAPVSQTISGLTVGDTYKLDFQWAASQFTDQTAATQQSWQVTFGSSTANTPVYNLPGQGFSGWMDYNTTFVATAASQTLTFLAVAGGPNVLPPFTLLDNVSLTDTTSVPEPSSLMMLGLGTVGVVFTGVRRRLKAAKV